MKKYTICLFDLDGTLTDSKQGIENSFKYAAKAYGISIGDMDITRYLGPPIRESARAILGETATDERVEGLIATYREYFTKQGMFENKVYAGIPEMLQRLADNELVLTVATSKVGIYAEQILTHFNLAKYFKMIVGCEMNGDRSTKKELIEHTFGKLGISNENAIMIGDRKQDIAGAYATGIDSIAAMWGYSEPNEFEAQPPTYYADSPADVAHVILQD